MIMEKLAKKDVNILTIEDPVEKTLDRINQMQVNNVAGLTFESGLRAVSYTHLYQIFIVG